MDGWRGRVAHGGDYGAATFLLSFSSALLGLVPGRVFILTEAKQ